MNLTLFIIWLERKQHQRRSSTRVSCLALVVRNILKHEDGARHGKRWRARWRFSVCRSGTIVFFSNAVLAFISATVLIHDCMSGDGVFPANIRRLHNSHQK